jgi:methylthioribulose-1-phosphate dehydratase
MNYPELICELCKQFYHLGWVSGTGGGMSIRDKDTGDIYIAPSGVQKERIKPEEIFILDEDGKIAHYPEVPGKKLKLSECTPLFEACYELRNAGAVIHSHSIWAVLATNLISPYNKKAAFCVSGFEMQKGIKDHKVADTLKIPIIENTEKECDLADSLKKAIEEFPKTQAVLVRNHGVYVWGDTWQKAKTQAECYDYLFRVAVERKRLGV